MALRKSGAFGAGWGQIEPDKAGQGWISLDGLGGLIQLVVFWGLVLFASRGCSFKLAVCMG